MDSYSLERVDFGRGPNAALFNPGLRQIVRILSREVTKRLAKRKVLTQPMADILWSNEPRNRRRGVL